MVAGLSRKKKSQAAYVDASQRARSPNSSAQHADFEKPLIAMPLPSSRVMAAYKLPQDTAGEQAAARGRHPAGAARRGQVPLEVARQAAGSIRTARATGSHLQRVYVIQTSASGD